MPAWVAKADAFIDECRAHARHLNRIFYPSGHGPGVPESNSIWFDASKVDGHFLLGCSFQGTNRLSFLGIYFTEDPADADKANTAPILNIGLDGAAAVLVDGHAVVFTPVRPFDTQKVTTVWSGEYGLNCQDPKGPDGVSHTFGGGMNFDVDFSQLKSRGLLTLEARDFKQTDRYEAFFLASENTDVIWDFGQVLIGSRGQVYVQKKFFAWVCETGSEERRQLSHLLVSHLCQFVSRN
jgi:hypothetical protein